MRRLKGGEPKAYNGLIILEGPDGGGKTTLASQLLDLWRPEYPRTGIVRGSDRDMPADGYLEALRNAQSICGLGGMAIMDRSHWSFLIYETFDPTPRESPDIPELNAFLMESFPWILRVICLPTIGYDQAKSQEELVNLVRAREVYAGLFFGHYLGPVEAAFPNMLTISYDYVYQDQGDIAHLALNRKLRHMQAQMASAPRPGKILELLEGGKTDE